MAGKPCYCSSVGFVGLYVCDVGVRATVRRRYYVEFGVESGVVECNSLQLRQMYGWTGLMMDGFYDNPSIGLHKCAAHTPPCLGVEAPCDVVRV